MSSTVCKKTLGERASVKRKTPQPDWFLYQCKIRGTFDSYEASRAKENVVAVQSDINSASESQTQHNMGKGNRNKRPRIKFTVDESHDSSRRDASTDGMYGPTQFDTPSIPPESSANSVRITRQVVNSYCVDSVVSVPSISDNTRFAVERSNANALESHQSISLFDVNSPSSTAGSSRNRTLEGSRKNQRVRMIRSLGGASVSDCLQLMAHVNWEGKPKKGSIQKHGLQNSIITKAVFAHTVYFSSANTIDCSVANNVDCSAANTVNCSAANTVDYSAANTTGIIQGITDTPAFRFARFTCSFSDVNWTFVLGRQMEVRYGRSTERTSGRSIIIRITSTSDVQPGVSGSRASGCRAMFEKLF
ncbi:hypothetical protein GHT06_015232 [Daphnia sinensis]|uniref:Uncharacterized protein n=1 Tax=Daphnia sinensis TaxID=1820382 RepID=A0AAD5L978_9CRUS|nr:hypothetical protein GHT06_015232 [Daphnia sinensis]